MPRRAWLWMWIWNLGWVLVLGLGAAAARAEAPPEPAAVPAKAKPGVETIAVIGSKEKVEKLPGAGVFLDAEDIRSQGYDDINRVLRQAPGVYVREEDGYGLFGNVSLRGVDSQRSSKITVMEDGIPTAPAVYSAPAAYYTPTVGRMSGVEVLKGSSQIAYGPHTTGGVINYLSTPISEGLSGRLFAAYGTDNEIRHHAYVSQAWNTGIGTFGALVEYYFRRTDGFKRIDATASIGSDDDTGFRKSEPMIKLFWEPDTERYHRFEAKLGFSELDADETYLGLTDGDFDADFARRYSASRFDNIDSKHRRSYLRHTTELADGVVLSTTAYHNTFYRNWFKLRGSGADLGNPATYACWTGQAACNLRYRNNRREYYSGGIQSVLDWDFGTGTLGHHMHLGARLHQDRMNRDQDDYTFVQLADGSIDWAASFAGASCSGGCEIQKARAWSFFVEDRIQIGDRWTVKPGVRLETIRYEYHRPGQPTRSEHLAYLSPGIGATFALTDALVLFGGVHRGGSAPGPKGAIDGLREETSLGYELGSRWSPWEFFGTEIALFHTDFDDLLVLENIGSGGAPQDENVGDVNVFGLEVSANFDPGLWRGWRVRNPWQLSFTLTRAELDGDSTSSDVESLFSGGRDGNDVPYIPRYQVALRTGIEHERLSASVQGVWVDDTYSTASNASGPVNPLTGLVDYNYGKTDSYFVLDFSVRYQLHERMAVTFDAQNVLDEEYVVSRHPVGSRPGKSRTVLVGVDYTF